MSTKLIFLAPIFFFLMSSCEHFIGYEEYIINRTDEDVVVYIRHENMKYNTHVKDSIILKNNEKYKILEVSEMNGWEGQFDNCKYMELFVPLDSLFVIKKANDTVKSYKLNHRKKWVYEKVGQQFKSKDCECSYSISEADF